ncbi:MAG: helix-turn-helix transcriptional regulator [Clostridia bacterium]|nr:helix-turn-helix transcriptional regulator [Clostridia bacterium]
MNIGDKIKKLRHKNQLTLEELANRSELTKGFLSQVENNMSSPSISTLEDILEALGSSLHEFFTEEKYEKIVFTDDDYFISEKDDYSISYIVPNAQKNIMEPIKINIKPGGRSEEISPHDGEDFGYVLSGEVKLIYGERKHILKEGQTFYLRCDEAYYLKNDKKEDAVLIWVSTPPFF